MHTNDSATSPQARGVPALIIDSAALPLNGAGSATRLSIEQAWAALMMWARGDKRFLPGFVTVEVIHDDGREVRKRVHHYPGTPEAFVREQISTLYGGRLLTHQYVDGPYFQAITGIDDSDPAAPRLFLTTLRHTRHPDYKDPVALAVAAGKPPPPTAQQNVERVLSTMHQLVAAGAL